ncbi:hypothetical protein BT63DRAFT_423003 [Microthyrium microscopicum]|uniref:ATP-grasp domain-containing protein n=1 Tax=Microthyrium microscopicum TaxID=703497 RepID=A0A6A6UGL1_9PEZI|nr:hypothetical protein BT63DRAFT_423003 [Microthyrium microscopicum]
MPSSTRKVLLLSHTNYDPGNSNNESSAPARILTAAGNSRAGLARILTAAGASVSATSWNDDCLDPEYLAAYDVVSFIGCWFYDKQPKRFCALVKDKIIPAQKLNSELRILNNPEIVLWNMEKTYLQDLEEAGFQVPKTHFIDDLSQISDPEMLCKHLNEVANDFGQRKSYVLKPSISASAKQTHLVLDRFNYSKADHEYLSSVLTNGLDGRLMVQHFEPTIHSGEYSLVFVGGEHTHTVLKMPAKNDFRSQKAFGGQRIEIGKAELPSEAKRAAEKLIIWLEQRFGEVSYCRIDGVIRDDGEFVFMEVEAIEPELWWESASTSRAKDLLCQVFLGKG